MVVFLGQNARRNHDIKTDNSSFERVADFKYFGTTLRDQNSIREGIKRRLKSGNSFCHLVQNLLPSGLQSKI